MAKSLPLKLLQSNRAVKSIFALIIASLCFKLSIAKERTLAQIPIQIQGYDGELMEPAISCDGNALFFNNSNAPGNNTNIYWASRTSGNIFRFRGEVPNVNSQSLDGVASQDCTGFLYFMSVRSYFQDFETIYRTNIGTQHHSDGVEKVLGISKKHLGDLIFDVEISRDGSILAAADGVFDGATAPKQADIFFAKNVNGHFERMANSAQILQNINSDWLEYAPSMSADTLLLCFSRTRFGPMGLFGNDFRIMCARRPNIEAPFAMPRTILQSQNVLEAPSISNQGNEIYYHAKTRGKNRIFKIEYRG